MKTTFFMYSKRLLSLALLLWQGTALAQVPGISWQKSFGGDSGDVAVSIQQTTEGGYIVAVNSESINGDVTGNHGNGDYWIVKLDSNADISWQKCLGGSDLEVAHAIQQTSDEGYIISGYSESNDGDITGSHGGGDIWIVKLDANGMLSWQKCLGGSDIQVAHAIQQTSDGGYIVAGWTSSYDGDITGNHGNQDYWMVKLDSSGNLNWQKCFGGTGWDLASSIQQTTDGGYILVGESKSNDGDVTGNHGGTDYWIVKLDANGDLSWQKSVGGSSDDGATSIQQTTDGGYIVMGGSTSNDGDVTGNHGGTDYWIVKLDANGNLSWQKSLGGSNTDNAFYVKQTIDGGYIVTGCSKSNDGNVTGNHGNYDYWIVKLAASGNLSWQKCLGGSNWDNAYSIQQTTDGGYIVAGFVNSIDGDVTENHGSRDAWIVKLKNFGVGIEEVNMIRGLSMWPNPVGENHITVTYNLSVSTEVEIRMMDVLGNCVGGMERGIVSTGEQSRAIEVGHLASGVYFLEIRTAYGRETVRWVKE